MYCAEFDNVNEAFRELCQGIEDGTIATTMTTSRNGDVLQVDGVSVIVYTRPRQRVLFNEVRDANPFFHMYESLWMLAGRNDVKPLELYNSKIASVASDDGDIFNGAYGYRWRNAEWITVEETECGITEGGDTDFEEEAVVSTVDQLNCIIRHLRNYPNSRRAVLQMWNVKDDLLKIDSESRLWYSKDVCCNLSVCFALSNGNTLLDMTVFNRSNDLVWGSLGANVVHFSFLQEYVADCLGVGMGNYSQVSNNLHCYVNNWSPEDWLGWEAQALDKGVWSSHHYPTAACQYRLVDNKRIFDAEVMEFCKLFSYLPHASIDLDGLHRLHGLKFKESWLQWVARPMMMAFLMHKRRDYGAAREWVLQVEATDWRVAGLSWLNRREANHEARESKKKVALAELYKYKEDKPVQE